jgi:hypothetical protein
MSNATSPFLGFANFVMAATPLMAVVAGYLATLAH